MICMGFKGSTSRQMTRENCLYFLLDTTTPTTLGICVQFQDIRLHRSSLCTRIFFFFFFRITRAGCTSTQRPRSVCCIQLLTRSTLALITNSKLCHSHSLPSMLTVLVSVLRATLHHNTRTDFHENAKQTRWDCIQLSLEEQILNSVYVSLESRESLFVLGWFPHLRVPEMVLVRTILIGHIVFKVQRHKLRHFHNHRVSFKTCDGGRVVFWGQVWGLMRWCLSRTDITLQIIRLNYCS